MSEVIKVFKFREGNVRDLDAFFNNYLWFASMGSLNDPYEGFANFSSEGITDALRIEFLKRVSASESGGKDSEKRVREFYLALRSKGKDAFSKHVDEQAKKILRSIHDRQRDETFVYSLSCGRGDHHIMPSPLDNMQMWSHYAGGFKGFCIEYDFDRLRTSIEKKNASVFLGFSELTYARNNLLPTVSLKRLMEGHVGGDKQVSSDEIFRTFSTKHASWEYENEVRLLSNSGGKIFFDPMCIRAIYLASPMPEWSKAFLRSAAASKGGHIKLFDVHLHDKEYKLGVQEACTSGPE